MIIWSRQCVYRQWGSRCFSSVPHHSPSPSSSRTGSSPAPKVALTARNSSGVTGQSIWLASTGNPRRCCQPSRGLGADTRWQWICPARGGQHPSHRWWVCVHDPSHWQTSSKTPSGKTMLHLFTASASTARLHCMHPSCQAYLHTHRFWSLSEHCLLGHNDNRLLSVSKHPSPFKAAFS